MNSPSPMSREELLEVAVPDALGLLDEYDSALFARSFFQASEDTRSEVVELQASVATDPLFLGPIIDPPESLRGQVVSGVRHTIDSIAALPPLAFVGGVATPRPTPTMPAQRTLHLDGIWRAASFLLIGALLVSIFFNLRFLERVESISRTALDLRNDQQLEHLVGRSAWTLLGDPGTTRRSLLPGAGSSVACAGFILIDERGESPQLLLFGMPAGEEFVLSITDQRGVILTQAITPSTQAGFSRALALQISPSDISRLVTSTVEIRCMKGNLMLASA